MSSLKIFAAMVGCLTALVSIPLFVRFRWPAAIMWMIKLYVSALSWLLLASGILITIIGATTGSLFVTALGLFNIIVYSIHLISITAPPEQATGFEQAFGLNWETFIHPEQSRYFFKTRRTLVAPNVPKPRLQQNIAFTTVPGTDRHLFCDIWQPSEKIEPSGLAFIYFHGSAFYFLDKDYGTRPLFRHLAAHGHVIMDVAYRLAPETDIMGMVHDVKRAIAWLKKNAHSYAVDPNLIVVAGGSAGAHLALLASYTADDEPFRPRDLAEQDLSVAGVVSIYGPTSLEDLYYHTKQHLTTRSIPKDEKKHVPTKVPRWIMKSIGKDYHRLGLDKGFENIGTLAPLMGGHPGECPEPYAECSPITHVHAGCPPTLLIHGEHDILAPVTSTLSMFNLLISKNVPTVMHILPQTDHGFDLVLPKISPSAHNAFYDLERFLALMAILPKPSARSKQHVQPQPKAADAETSERLEYLHH